MRDKIIIGLAIVVCVVLSFIYVQSTPQYSLYKAYQAARDHDYPTFTKYVDVDSVTTHAVDNTLRGAGKEIEKRIGNDKWGRFGWRTAKRYIRSAKPKMDSLVKSWIEHEVTSGNMMETTFKDVNLFVIFTKTTITKDGDKADLLVTIEKKPVHFAMKRMGDYWQVYEMDIDRGLLKSLLPMQ